ncbi:hypothetical protein ACFWVU_14195 [Streptomyces sp. NPDC058686]|uniref:hypothetical protein n=1 Tax=Streptomyces sp. NPDC058686 TaxID=3346599 RepID=UPI00366A2296
MNPYAVLAAAASRWDRVAARIGPEARDRLAELLAAVRRPDTGHSTGRGPAGDAAARAAAELLAQEIPAEFGTEQTARLAPDATLTRPDATTPDLTGPGLTVHGYAADDLAVLLSDGHRMVGPVLGPVRRRLLAEPALDAEAVLQGGGSPFAPELIRLRGAGGQLRLPRFQFSEDTLPWLVVLEVNAVLAADRDPWGAADWWLSANTWLGGTSPAALLGSGRDRQLADTARFLMEGE